MNLEELQLQHIVQDYKRLKQENHKLKELLKLHNIDISNIEHSTKDSKLQKIKYRIDLFRSLFKGRDDIYAVCWESKNGRSGYSPACQNEWHPTLCEKPKIKCANCQNRRLLSINDQVIYDHLSGKHTVGIYPLLQDETCWFLAVDFDKKDWQKDAKAFISTCKEIHVPASVERSRSGNGCHVWIFFQKAIPSRLARKFGNILLEKTLERRYEVGIDSFDRLFPNQDTMPKGGFGNLIALPLQYHSRKQNNSEFVDETFVPYKDQWQYLSTIQKMKPVELYKIVNEYSENEEITSCINEGKLSANEPINNPNSIEVIHKDSIYISKEGLPSPLIKKIINLATFNNPEFYKAQSKRQSTYGIPKKIDCTTISEKHIMLPWGCKDVLERLCKEQSITLDIKDQTNSGDIMSFNFSGELFPLQEEAVQELNKHNIGILSATTGFGKTVVAASLMAKRKVNTLIIVHRKQLIDQWKERLTTFLKLDKKQIGQIGGGKNKQTGIIDIATIQSLNYKGEIKDLVTEYGQIIVDECHHISAFSFEQVLKKANAKFICGLTATPIRKDGLHPIIIMQLGPIRYKITEKQQAKVRPFEHILRPRFTSFKSNLEASQKDIQKIYNEIITNKNRNLLIFNDVLKALDAKLSPIILTERIEHVYELESKFKGFAKNILVLTGGMNKKEEQKRLSRLKEISDDEEMLIIATGKYIGEGFDFPRLDTLFLAMPLSWKGLYSNMLEDSTGYIIIKLK